MSSLKSAAMPTNLFKSAKDVVEYPLTTKLSQANHNNKLSNRVRLLNALRIKTKPKADLRVASRKLSKETCCFNTAVWLTFKTPPIAPVGLILSYKDSKGEFAVVVDDVKPSEGLSVLLSGNTELNIHGELEYLKASCTGFSLGQDYIVEDAHIKKMPI